ncbi:serine/threonine-protein kinase PrkC [Clostridium saccharobutylicum]|uniref:Stk1 family PASTA domain-containing Ser/Thr kinase n=1 Tax=Clostridium saccharobutylicum TaxID=169679 RepID=UPI000983C913|nr:Stk1 family PASTA domain-containing Ser/Thr kinase [Clostridium saccharobutylicum]AQS09288.1 serine/threonine-protein kinase PrkC [Clostridium saccharobutylicum]MBC2435210.1 Stk1 family PASTA domain-containing Ser/Thr kinase [Clostridium saccharobutylicum]NSB87525.1 serine/threonine-protein kinase [Clostridium saccharobutylicum]NYC28345.1 serine/threonine-protein kinase [Clostridium saccharobutylicum]OOM15541.1 serine/threonine-protein kinase PrkC [Clostridium saccharobutylicum]
MNGIILGSRYELLEKIGEGGMSEVFKARDNKLNRFVAAKILKKEFGDNIDIVEKFKGEATAIATLSDNNIVNILDVGTQDDINYIVMEYVKGNTLKDIIKQTGKMNYETAISNAIQIARALDCAHRNKIIHRDVKPQNILVTEDGSMKVTDFGIAKSSTSSTITNTSTIMGSAHYLSPEQAKGSFIDCRTDLYSLGVVLYEMVTGTLPFQADTAVTIALKHLQENVVPPKNLNSKIPDSLNILILKAMEKEPSKRYQTAKEMIADLQKIKDNPNARIDAIDDDDEHTIIMSAVTEEMSKQKEAENKLANDDDDDYYYDDDEFEEEEKSKSNKSKIIKIAIGVAAGILLIILGVAAFKAIGSSGGKEVEVPNVIGQNVDDAKKQLESVKLVLVVASTEDSDKPEGTIIKSNIDAGTKVKENTEIRVIVSGGAAKLKMPDLTDYDLDKAKDILASFSLKIDSTSYEYSDAPRGQIIRQNPQKDEQVSSDTKISVVVSKGPQQVRQKSNSSELDDSNKKEIKESDSNKKESQSQNQMASPSTDNNKSTPANDGNAADNSSGNSSSSNGSGNPKTNNPTTQKSSQGNQSSGSSSSSSGTSSNAPQGQQADVSGGLSQKTSNNN